MKAKTNHLGRWWPFYGLLLGGIVSVASGGLPIWPVLLVALGVLAVAGGSYALHARLLKGRGGVLGAVLVVFVLGALATVATIAIYTFLDQ